MKLAVKQLPSNIRQLLAPVFEVGNEFALKQLLSRVNSDLQTSYNDIELGDIIAPTTFIHSGYSQNFILMCFDHSINLYIKQSPNPKRDGVTVAKDYYYGPNAMLFFSEFKGKSFTVEAVDWKTQAFKACTYIIIRRTEE